MKVAAEFRCGDAELDTRIRTTCMLLRVAHPSQAAIQYQTRSGC